LPPLISHEIIWRRLDLPGYDVARLLREDSDWRLTGNAAFLYLSRVCSLAYAIRCDQEWRTTAVTISGWVGDQTIALNIAADRHQQWYLNNRPAPLVNGCLDIDLAFSPSTNLLPIRRLDLRPGEDASVRAAWLRFPEFALEPLEQRYRRIDDTTYQYESADGAFRRTLRTNSLGFVVSYPEFWEALREGQRTEKRET